MPRTEGAQALFREGEEAAGRGDWRKAAELLGQAAEREPRNVSWHLAHAQCLQQAGLDARDALQRALALDPDCAEACWGMAAQYTLALKTHEARAWMKRCVEARLRRGERSRPAPLERVEVPATTLVCVDCRNYALAADAMARTLEQCRFERALFLTDADTRIDGVETVRIQPIRTIPEYSSFMLKDLERHIASDYALVMQWDGYVLNGRRWSAEFQQFDYVGAPWFMPQLGMVGNGGFSLRSRRLLRALQDPDLVPRTPEDVAICLDYRGVLESRHGIRFAPTEVAARFSFETMTPPEPTFGFHSVVHLAHTFGMSEAELAGYRPPNMPY